ncbi:MAG: RecQ family ATP-dependent DNA helicase [Myxococcota bacterium]|nr:RecQ family ATP-dependent DNA helicase [Myxococcota bacterium]
MSEAADHQEPEGSDQLLSALQEAFGFSSFQGGQRAVIQSVLSGQPTVAVMPTGAGKSLCYQLPALLLPGVTVVISPLISLMKDQVDGLLERKIPAAFLNSSLSPVEQQEVIRALAAKELKLLYVAPERFRQSSFCRALQRCEIALFAVDEAHCISRWGHDFRPDYTRLGQVLAELQPERILACTATATERVQRDIQETLGLSQSKLIVSGFLRENLHLEVKRCFRESERKQALLKLLKEEPGAVIIYATTRKRVEEYARVCQEAFGSAQVVAYHGGMSDLARDEAQERFMRCEARVAVATNAFGMGVDRGDVRAVVHVDLPRTVEGYYQEVGRAGRDRAPARCLLLYGNRELHTHRYLINQNHPSELLLHELWTLLRTQPAGLSQGSLEGEAKQRQGWEALEGALRQLRKVDAIRYDRREDLILPSPDQQMVEDLTELGVDLEALSLHRRQELSMLDEMRRYATDAPCRHAFLLQYFGEEIESNSEEGSRCPQPQAGCDRCRSPEGAALEKSLARELSQEEIVIIQKGLAGVARAEGRFGLQKVAKMLAGSKAKEIKGSSLVSLSTYGLLSELRLDGCARLMHLLLEEGLCHLNGSEYPLLQITPEGWSVMTGDTSPQFLLPEEVYQPPGSWRAHQSKRAQRQKRSATKESVEDLSPEGSALRQSLRRFRSERARQRGVPPYVVFSDRSLEGLLSQRPQDQSEFLMVHGLGPSKWNHYGEAILKIIADSSTEVSASKR